MQSPCSGGDKRGTKLRFETKYSSCGSALSLSPASTTSLFGALGGTEVGILYKVNICINH